MISAPVRMILFVCVALFFPLSLSAATLTTYGASGIDVNGSLFDAEFIDGSCIDLFSGCDDDSDFAIAADHIFDAMTSLLGLINATPAIDDNPQVAGCFAAYNCGMISPYMTSGVGSGVILLFNANVGSGIEDQLGIIGLDRYVDTSLSPGRTWTRWSLHVNEGDVAPVPLPVPILLLACAIACLFALSSFKNRPNLS